VAREDYGGALTARIRGAAAKTEFTIPPQNYPKFTKLIGCATFTRATTIDVKLPERAASQRRGEK
jgi:hypothetical protein